MMTTMKMRMHVIDVAMGAVGGQGERRVVDRAAAGPAPTPQGAIDGGMAAQGGLKPRRQLLPPMGPMMMMRVADHLRGCDGAVLLAVMLLQPAPGAGANDGKGVAGGGVMLPKAHPTIVSGGDIPDGMTMTMVVMMMVMMGGEIGTGVVAGAIEIGTAAEGGDIMIHPQPLVKMRRRTIGMQGARWVD